MNHVQGSSAFKTLVRRSAALVSIAMVLGGCTHREETMPKTSAGYGSWKSPLTAARVTAGALRFDHLVLDGDDLYWIEGRASESGRNVIVRREPDGRMTDVTPSGFNVRSRVHEYGGASYTVRGGIVYFSNFADQRLYRQAPGAAPVPLTTEGYYYADCRVDAARARLLCVREDHTKPGEPVNSIVAVPAGAPAKSSPDRVLASGADFYSNPILSPDGSRFAWLQWHHPNMPWDGTELWTAEVKADGSLGAKEKVAGSKDESIFQPEWSPDGTLFFVSDRTGYWNLYRSARLKPGPTSVEAIYPMSAEFGKPQWTFSQTTYAFLTANRLALTYTVDGRWKMALLETDPRRFEPIDLRFEPTGGVVATQRDVFFIGGSPTQAPAIARMSIAAAEAEVIRPSTADRVDPAWISTAEPVTFDSDGKPVHAFHYPPKSPDYDAPAGRASAAAGPEPRRSDQRHRGRARRRGAVLDQPRLRGAGRQLQRQHRLRPRLPDAPERPVGHRRCGGLRQRRALHGLAGARPIRRGSSSAAAAPAATPRWRH